MFRYFYTKQRLQLLQLHNRNRIEFYDYSSSDPYISGFIASEREWILEKPDYERDEHVSIVVMNSENQLLRLLLLKRPEVNGKVLVKLHLSLIVNVGEVYSIEEQYLMSVCEIRSNEYKAGPLSVEVLNPFRKLRLKFRGFLKNQETGDTKFVTFRLHWFSLTNVFDYACGLDSGFVANQLAKNKSKLIEVEDRIEQFGNVKGTVSIENGTEVEIFLWGMRSKSYYQNGLSVSRIIVVAKNGRALDVGFLLNKKFQYKFLYGVITNNKGIESITSLNTEANIENISLKFFKFEIKSSSNAVFLVKIKKDVKKIIRDASVNTTDAKCVCFFETFNITANLSSIQKELNFAYLAEFSKIPTKDLVITLDHKQATNIELTGGKGSSLAVLNRMSSIPKLEPKFEVPKAIVVTTNAFFLFLDENENVIKKIKELEKIAWSKHETLKSECARTQELIESHTIPSRVKTEIQKNLTKVFGNSLSQKYFAVRSSAIGEDTEEMSAAGQLATYLGVKGFDNLITAVVRCWSSQFNYNYTAYRRGYGQLINSSTAVIIQEMVECDVAGVMFTCDLQNGDERRIVITANYGLGESVVSGLIEPDAITVKVLVKNNDLSVKRTVEEIENVSVGKKEKYIAINEGGGTVELSVTMNNISKISISRNNIIKLAEIGLNIHAYYGSVRDIEWGISNDNVCIFQSRAVTSLDRYNEWEVMHDLDSGFAQESIFYSRVHWSENFPGASSPLCVSFTIRMLDFGFQSAKNRLNFTPYSHYPLPTFYNHLFVNLRYFPISSKPDANTNRAFPGQNLYDDEFTKTVAKPPKPGLYDRLKFYFNLVYTVLFSGLFVKRLNNQLTTRQWFPDKEKQTAEQLFDEITQNACQTFNSITSVHGPVSMTAAYFTSKILDILSSSTTNNDDVLSDFAKIQEANSGIWSAQVPKLIQGIVNAMEDKNVFNKMTDDQALNYLLSGSSFASRKFVDFIKHHGNRGFKEMDPYVLQWGDEPIRLIPVLKNSSKMLIEKNSKVQTVNEVISSLKTKPSYLGNLLLRICIPLSFRSTKLRERTKAMLVHFIAANRSAFYALAHKLCVEEGRLPEKDLLFFLTLSEIEQLIKQRNSSLVVKSKQRKHMHERLEKLQFPEVVKDWHLKQLDLSKNYTKLELGTSVKGTPITQHSIKGRAFVALHFEDTKDLKYGDILVTQTTDIGWSPYFTMVSGLVIETGGLNSHGSVIAREYGLPCVVGASNACHLFKTGETISIDGETGLVSSLKPGSTNDVS